MLLTCSSFILIVVVSAILGRMTVFIWQITPAEWLCDYGQTPDIQHVVSARSMQVHTRLFQIFFFLWLMQSVTLGSPLDTIIVRVIIAFSLLQLSLSDIKFQILQDQWIILIAIMALAVPGCFKAKLQGLLLPIIIYYALAFIQAVWSTQAPFGMGDAKLMAALGFYFGPSALFFIVCYAFLFSGAWAALLILQQKATKKDRMFFGPFLSIACIYFMRSTLSM